MDKKRKIVEYRDRLDRTLASPNLGNEASITSLVRKQLLDSSSHEIQGNIEEVVKRRTKEVSNFLDMARSASVKDGSAPISHGTSHGEWKLKQDNDQLRVLYREGPQGTPFHTLLVEGYVDGPIDVCLCVSWESTLYKKWWPQFSIPPFKIALSTCLKNVRIGEEISLVRVKVPWPVSTREAVVHFLELDYLDDDLIIILINTIPDKEQIDLRIHGFTSDGIPEAGDIVRIDMAGGVALQKVSPNKSYFRTIANFDLKLDFIPASFINFISRQLIGSGFKLFQKEVASVANGDDDFSKVLEEKPMYIRIRECLISHDKGKEPKDLDYEKSASALIERYPVERTQEDMSVDKNPVTICEIEEEETEQPLHLGLDQHMRQSSTNQIAELLHVSRESHLISSEVKQALCMLDKATAFVREHGFTDELGTEPLPTNQESLNLGRTGNSGLSCSNNSALREGRDAQKMEMDKPFNDTNSCSTIHNFRGAGMKPPSFLMGHDQQESTISNHDSGKIQEEASISSHDNVGNASTFLAPMPQSMNRVCEVVEVKANGAYKTSIKGSREQCKRKQLQRFCCL